MFGSYFRTLAVSLVSDSPPPPPPPKQVQYLHLSTFNCCFCSLENGTDAVSSSMNFIYIYMGHSPENWTKPFPDNIKIKLKHDFLFLNYCYISDVMCFEK